MIIIVGDGRAPTGGHCQGRWYCGWSRGSRGQCDKYLARRRDNRRAAV